MKRAILATTMALAAAIAAAQETPAPGAYPADYARAPRFKALIYYSTDVEEAHVEFAQKGIEFLERLTVGDGWRMDTTTTLAGLSDEALADYDLQIWLNTSPTDAEERRAFERYANAGGGWIGFHAAAYNDAATGWPWYVDFLGGGVFLCNNWPPQPVAVDVDTNAHFVTRNLPAHYIMPSSEYYMWEPSPRENPDVDVLVSISPTNYPLGLKDVVRWGDFPVVWTNRNYRMIYINAGHGGELFTDATQNLLYVNALQWIASRSPKGNPFVSPQP